MSIRAFLRCVPIAALPCLLACADTPTPTQPGSLVATLAVFPPTTTTPVPGTVQLTAELRDVDGVVLTGQPVAWVSSAPAIASVDNSGLVTGLADGSAVITATSGTASGTSKVFTNASGNVTLGYASLMPGQSTDAEVVLRDAAGAVIPGGEVLWTSSDAAIAEVRPNGFVIARGSGAVTISATTQGITASAPLSVQAMPQPVATPVVEFSPAVYRSSGGKGLTMIVDGTATTTAVTFSVAGTAAVPLQRLGNSRRFIAVLTDGEVLNTCSPLASPADAAMCVFASITVVDGSASGITLNAVAPEIGAAAPLPALTPLGVSIQRSDYVVNIRDDGLRQDGNTAVVAQLFYQHFADVFDYLMLSEVATTYGGAYYTGVRTRVTGLGLGLSDNSALYGASATGKLLGFVNTNNYFDLAAQVFSHEMAHAFCCFLANTSLSSGSPHWPLSTTAFAIMGGNGSPGSNAGNAKLTPISGGYRVDAQSPYGGFNMLELYLLGLADPSEVGPQTVFQNQAQSAAIGQTLTGSVSVVTIEDITAANGVRPTVYAGSPVTFRVATVVVSRGRLLLPTEMAYYERAAKRGEATTSFDGQYSTPFFVNTQGRGLLVSRIP